MSVRSSKPSTPVLSLVLLIFLTDHSTLWADSQSARFTQRDPSKANAALVAPRFAVRAVLHIDSSSDRFALRGKTTLGSCVNLPDAIFRSGFE